MGYNLTIDQGNSATKVALWRESNMVKSMRYDDLTVVDIKALANDYELDALILSSVKVVDTSILDVINNICRNVYILNHQTKLPIKIEYVSPETLGHDRIAAAVGANMISPGKTLLVVDYGTAVTYDIVTNDGRYIGGNIAPGLNMRIDALHHNTARLPQIVVDGDCPLWGNNTDTAIRAGVIYGLVGELTYYRSKLPDDVVVVCTGGYAEIISGMVDFGVIVEPNLVNIGLNSIILYNENK